MFCGRCGHPVPPGARFCGNCGNVAPPSTTDVGTSVVRDGTVQSDDAAAGRRAWRIGVAVLCGLVLAVPAGWAAHFLPFTATQVHAAGVAGAAEADSGEQAAGDSATAPDAGPGPATSALVTSCGQVLDVVPVAAVSRQTVVEVTMELHPVCPDGEWISSGQFRVRLRAADGSTLANGTFDLSRERLLVPGYGDPASYFVARFGPGTAWVAPDSLAVGIAAGSVLVECEDLDSDETTPVASGEVTAESTVTAETGVTDIATTPRETALAALRRQARADDPSVSDLEGSWVPQLSSKKEGTFDHYDGHTYSLADIYQQFLVLRLKYPNVRLLNSSDWHSYTLKHYWVVIAGVPFIGPNQPNSWCNSRGIPPSQCFAKRLIRDGAPEGTTKHR